MVRVKVLFGFGLDIKNDFYTCKENTEWGNLSIGPIDYACNERISLYLLRHYFIEH